MTWAPSGRNGTTLVFEEQAKVDMRVVHPGDVKKMLLKQARMVYGKKWHEYEVLKEGVWAGADPSYALKKDNDAWTVKHRHVVGKLVVEGGCVQNRLYDTSLVGRVEVWRLQQRRYGKAQAVPLSVMEESEKLDPRMVGEVGIEGYNFEGGLEVVERQLEEELLDGPQVGIRKTQTVGACQPTDSETTLPPMALCSEFWAGWCACGWSVV